MNNRQEITTTTRDCGLENYCDLQKMALGMILPNQNMIKGFNCTFCNTNNCNNVRQISSSTSLMINNGIINNHNGIYQYVIIFLLVLILK